MHFFSNLLGNASIEEAHRVFRDRAARGFNVIQDPTPIASERADDAGRKAAFEPARLVASRYAAANHVTWFVAGEYRKIALEEKPWDRVRGAPESSRCCTAWPKAWRPASVRTS